MTRIRFLTEAAVIAAMYAVLALIPGGSGQFQVRVAEALTILPFFTPAAIPGLFVGCLVYNIFVPGGGLYDIVLGSLATLLAAYLTYKMPKKQLAPLPPVIVNAVAVAVILKLAMDAPMLITMGTVAAGEIVACYILGYPLLLVLERNRQRLFKRTI